MEAKDIAAAADLLVTARRDRQPMEELPAALRPGSDEDAYAIQEAVVERLGGAIVGWKVGAKGIAGEPNCAPLVAGTLFQNKAEMQGLAVRPSIVEGELAFRFGMDLPPRRHPYLRSEVLAGVESIHAAAEVIDSRFVDFQKQDPRSVLADFLSNGALVVGPAITAWRRIDPEHQPVTLKVDGREVAHAVGGNPAGDPLRLLVWLANFTAKRGRGLKKGDVVTTGSCTGINWVEPGSTAEVEFPRIGRVAVTIGASAAG